MPATGHVVTRRRFDVMHEMDLAPLTWHAALTTWRLAPVWDVLVLAAAAGYVAALLLARRSHPGSGWPWYRTVSFVAGLAVLVLTLNGAVDVYGDVLFGVHMVEHLLLIMVVPVLVAAGQPLRLLTRFGPDRRGERVEAALRSRPVAILTHPLTGLLAYALVIVATHLTPFMQVMMTHPWLRQLEYVLYLGGGYLFFVALVGSEPIRWQVPYPFRLVLLFLGMGADTFVGVVLLTTGRVPWPAYAAMQPSWGPGPLADIHLGGAIMWVVGDGLMFAVMVAVMFQWLADRSGVRAGAGTWVEGVRRTAFTGDGPDAARWSGVGDVDEDEGALEAYNAMLRRLGRR